MTPPNIRDYTTRKEYLAAVIAWKDSLPDIPIPSFDWEEE